MDGIVWFWVWDGPGALVKGVFLGFHRKGGFF